MHKFKILFWRHLLQNFNISYAKSFLGDQVETVIQTVDVMIRRRLPGAIVFENLFMPGDQDFMVRFSHMASLGTVFNEKTRELLSKCLVHHILIICNCGSQLSDFFVKTLLQFASEEGLSAPKIVIESDHGLPSQAHSGLADDRFDSKNHPSSIFYETFQNSREIAACIQSGAQIVFSKNLSYSSLILGTNMAHFDWSEMDQNQLASATIVGSLLESDVQSEHFSWQVKLRSDSVPEKSKTLAIAEFSDDGSCVISKPNSVQGFLNRLIVKKLYEIEDPNALITQEIIVDICKLVVEDLGENHVRVRGAIGHPLNAIEDFDDIPM